METKLEFIPIKERGSSRWYVIRYGTPERVTPPMEKKKAVRAAAELMGMTTDEYKKLYRKVIANDAT